MLEQGPTSLERARALARLAEVRRRARFRRRVRVAVLGAVSVAVALAVGLPAALAGSPGTQVVHVVGPGPTTSIPAPTTPVTSIPGGAGASAPTSTPAAQLRGSDTQSVDGFGSTVAGWGSTVVVGAPGHGGGRAYVFADTAAGWAQGAELHGSDTATGDNFGAAVAVSGSTVVVGAPGHRGGRAYVFARTATGWTATAELKGSDTGLSDGFGTALALSATALVVSAPGHAGSSGRVYVFVHTARGWEQTAELQGTGSAANDQFGTEVALSGPTMAVSAPSHLDTAGSVATGAVYLFSQTARGWAQQDQLDADVSSYGAGTFGDYLAVSGRSLLAVATGGHMGIAYAFGQTGRRWLRTGPLTVPGIGDDFAGPVALTGGRGIVGSGTFDSGAYLFAQTATGWKLTGVLDQPDGGLVSAVALTDSDAIVSDTAGVFVYNI